MRQTKRGDCQSLTDLTYYNISVPAETYLEAVIEDLLPDNVLLPEGGNELKQAEVKGYNQWYSHVNRVKQIKLIIKIKYSEALICHDTQF